MADKDGRQRWPTKWRTKMADKDGRQRWPTKMDAAAAAAGSASTAAAAGPARGLRRRARAPPPPQRPRAQPAGSASAGRRRAWLNLGLTRPPRTQVGLERAKKATSITWPRFWCSSVIGCWRKVGGASSPCSSVIGCWRKVGGASSPIHFHIYLAPLQFIQRLA